MLFLLILDLNLKYASKFENYFLNRYLQIILKIFALLGLIILLVLLLLNIINSKNKLKSVKGLNRLSFLNISLLYTSKY